MRRALSEYLVSGTLTTNLSFHRWLMDNARFVRGEYDTHFFNEEYQPAAESAGDDLPQLAAILAAAFAAARNNHRPAAAAPANQSGGSAWKTAGRLDSLRR
jgi:acetyl/propionyl-CoA carboxylase alpha subunit